MALRRQTTAVPGVAVGTPPSGDAACSSLSALQTDAMLACRAKLFAQLDAKARASLNRWAPFQWRGGEANAKPALADLSDALAFQSGQMITGLRVIIERLGGVLALQAGSR